MRIVRSQGASSATYYNCHIETGNRSNYQIGERILFDDGKIIIGPLRIVGKDTHKIVVTADDDYAAYVRIDATEAELVNLEPITPLDYEPVTNSIFLDGFLGASYQDNSGIVRVDIDLSMKGLKEYYIGLLNENNIEYRITEDGFVFPNISIIQSVFERQKDLMPPKYVIGFISSFIVKSKVRINRNPRYERYMFILPSAEDYYDNLAPKGLYYISLRGQCALFSLFGSFEPLARYIDSIELGADESLFAEEIHYESIFREVAPELIVKSFTLSGLNLRITGRDKSATYLNVTIKENEQPRSVSIAVCSDDGLSIKGCDYVVRFEGRKPVLYDLSERRNLVGTDLFYHPAFNYSKELRDYLQIIFNKM